MTTRSNSQKGNKVFAFAAIHAELAIIPSFVSSLLGVLDENDKFLVWVFGSENASTLANNALLQGYSECFQLFVILFGYGYWRLYTDGPDRQPLFLFLGGFGKLLVSLLFLRFYLRGAAEFGIVLVGTLPDFIFGIYFLYIWRTKLNYSLVPTSRGNGDKAK